MNGKEHSKERKKERKRRSTRTLQFQYLKLQQLSEEDFAHCPEHKYYLKKENKLTKMNDCCALYIYFKEFTQMQTHFKRRLI